MSGPVPETAAMAREARAARAQFLSTLHELQARLAPRTLVNERVELLRARGTEMAEDAIDVARDRPQMVGAIGGGLLLLWLRRPIFRLLRRLFFRRDETDRAADQLKAADSQ